MTTFKHAHPNILQIDNSSIEFMSFGTFQELPPDWEQSFTREGKRFFIKYGVVLKQRFQATRFSLRARVCVFFLLQIVIDCLFY